MEIRNVDKWILPVYHPYTLDYDTRFNVFFGSAGSGKSYFVFQKIILKALQMKRKVLVIRKVGATIKNSVWDLSLSVLEQLGNPVKSINIVKTHGKSVTESMLIDGYALETSRGGIFHNVNEDYTNKYQFKLPIIGELD